MREMKFRGKHQWENEWVYGSVISECYILKYIDLAESWSLPGHDHKLTCRATPVRPNTVGQFTGLKDKNGNEIYEGDIVKCYDHSAIDNTWNLDKIHIGVIEYTSPCYPLKIQGKQTVNTPALKHWENDVFLEYWCNAENIEVIGNIHDNPELVNQPAGGALNMNIDPKLGQQEEMPQAPQQATETEVEQAPVPAVGEAMDSEETED